MVAVTIRLIFKPVGKIAGWTPIRCRYSSREHGTVPDPVPPGKCLMVGEFDAGL
jgi:hypothetical protein